MREAHGPAQTGHRKLLMEKALKLVPSTHKQVKGRLGLQQWL